MARRLAGRSALGVVVDEIELQILNERSDAAIAQQRRKIVRIGTHSQVLIIDKIKCIIYNMYILSMKVAMTKPVWMTRNIVS